MALLDKVFQGVSFESLRPNSVPSSVSLLGAYSSQHPFLALYPMLAATLPTMTDLLNICNLFFRFILHTCTWVPVIRRGHQRPWN